MLAYHRDSERRIVELDNILSCCDDPIKILVDSMLLLVGLTLNLNHWSADPFWSVLAFCLQKLYTMNGSTVSRQWRVEPGALRNCPEMLPDVVCILLENGADPNLWVWRGRCIIHYILAGHLFRELRCSKQGFTIRRRILSALIEAGADTSRRDYDGRSPDVYAWDFDQGDVWLEALKENGLHCQANWFVQAMEETL